LLLILPVLDGKKFWDFNLLCHGDSKQPYEPAIRGMVDLVLFWAFIDLGYILAVIQIGGSCLLLFRKTLLLGSVVLFSFMLNLTLINIFYQVNAGALLQSVILTIGILFLILLDYNRLVAFFLKTNRVYRHLQ
jgi:hypothetical protein